MEKHTDDKELKERFSALQEKIEKLGFTGKELNQLPSLNLFVDRSHSRQWSDLIKSTLVVLSVFVAVVFLGLCTVWLIEWPLSRFSLSEIWFSYYDTDIDTELCLVNTADELQDFGRPPVNCEICHGLSEVPRISKITPHEFEMKYAYSGTPVIIQDAIQNWTATKSFNFKFFKELYTPDSPVLQNVELKCQFFPYKTSFESLGEVFNMSEERANLTDGTEPWYIGWLVPSTLCSVHCRSNCDSSAANVLRQHYQRPYFLPQTAESSRTDWIFMGSPGYGAHLHIDNVNNPSWQAQITGTKLWTLEPPPECYFECVKQIQVTVNPGEIIVVDTNSWYHSTLILGNEMSITIGSEYD